MDEPPGLQVTGVPFDIIVTLVNRPETADMSMEEVLSELKLPENPNAPLAGPNEYQPLAEVEITSVCFGGIANITAYVED